MRWNSVWLTHGWLITIFILIIIVSTILAPNSLSLQSVSAMSVYAVEIGLIAFGEMWVILSGDGGIDLSVGSMYALSQVVLGVLVLHHVVLVVGVLLALVAGLIMGMVNGLIVTVTGIPAIIVTLATMYAYSGLALVLTHGIDISPFPTSFNFIGQSQIMGLPFQLIAIYVPVALLMALVLGRTRYGWNLQLVGSNPVAARFSGISVVRTRIIAYATAGLLSAIAGIVDASRLVTARPDAGGTANLTAITIAVLGGTQLQGGEGSILGTVVATFAITWLSYSFGLANINSVYEEGAVGFVLLLTLLFQRQNFRTRLFKRQKFVS
jgi:ribose/xylose/arabinose/galactoside ABC-type transport system permease subunit